MMILRDFAFNTVWSRLFLRKNRNEHFEQVRDVWFETEYCFGDGYTRSANEKQ